MLELSYVLRPHTLKAPSDNNFCFQSYFNKLKGREIAYRKHPDIYHFCCSFPNFHVSLQYYFPSFLRAVFSNSFQCRSAGKKFSQFSLSRKSDMSSFMSVSERYFCCIQNSGFEVVLFFLSVLEICCAIFFVVSDEKYSY